MDVLKQPIQKFEGQVDDLLVSWQSINFAIRQQWLQQNHKKCKESNYLIHNQSNMADQSWL